MGRGCHQSWPHIKGISSVSRSRLEAPPPDRYADSCASQDSFLFRGHLWCPGMPRRHAQMWVGQERSRGWARLRVWAEEPGTEDLVADPRGAPQKGVLTAAAASPLGPATGQQPCCALQPPTEGIHGHRWGPQVPELSRTPMTRTGWASGRSCSEREPRANGGGASPDTAATHSGGREQRGKSREPVSRACSAA